MKKLLYFSIICMSVACAKKEKPVDYTLFSGQVTNNTADSVFVFNSDFKQAIAIDSAGSFSDTLRVENGYYSFRIGRESSAIYLEEKYNLNLSIDLEEFDESIAYTGEGAKENNFLAGKYMLEEQAIPSYKDLFLQEEEEFIMAVKAIRDETKKLLTKDNLNPEFVKFQEQEADYAYAGRLSSYEGNHSYYAQKDDFVVSETFLDNQIDFTLDDEEAYKNSANYRQLISSVFNNNLNRLVDKNDSSVVGAAKLVSKFLQNQYIKNEVLNNYANYLLKPTAELDSALIFLKDNVDNQDYILNYDDRYDKMVNLLPGKVSPTFSDYENHAGGTGSLSDFAGKYVYIDVWATWCGPCIAEIPALKKLEGAMHGKNIAFVSISVDRDNAHETWIDMVVEKELGGTQLFAADSWESDFTRAYEIISIPRFLLIGPEGNIVDADAKRPSNPALLEELMELGI